jgi:4-hydroxy-tetrahydrodipicolinate reductase
MGRMLMSELNSGVFKAHLAAAVDREDDEKAGITSDRVSAFRACDVLIDFTAPEATMDHIALAVQYKKPIVIGTTGLNPRQEENLVAASKHVPVFYSANMSIGVNVLAALVEQAAARLSDEFDIEIFEAHHRHKADAPSGTALLLGRAAAKGRGVNLSAVQVLSREGQTGARAKGAVGFSVFRGGDVVGDHTVTFAGEGERIELSHKASDRAIFARGAIRAALWLAGRPPGAYSMRDMLNL